MKKLILIVVLIIVPSLVFAAWPFGGSKKKDPALMEEQKPVVKRFCSHSIQIRTGVFFIFKSGCEEFKHVGVVDNNKIIVLNEDGEVSTRTEAATEDARNDTIEKEWGELIPVKFETVD